MEEKYFMHRIKLENGTIDKGIEVHDTLDSAVLSFHNYRAMWANNNPDHPNVLMVSLKIENNSGNAVFPFSSGNAVFPFRDTWVKEDSELPEKYFMHFIRKDGNTYTKNIDVCETKNDAIRSFDAQMAYGYGNPNHTNVSFVSCEITDVYGTVLQPYDETWIKPEEELAEQTE